MPLRARSFPLDFLRGVASTDSCACSRVSVVSPLALDTLGLAKRIFLLELVVSGHAAGPDVKSAAIPSSEIISGLIGVS